jgi:hypothetical protein
MEIVWLGSDALTVWCNVDIIEGMQNKYQQRTSTCSILYSTMMVLFVAHPHNV